MHHICTLTFFTKALFVSSTIVHKLLLIERLDGLNKNVYLGSWPQQVNQLRHLIDAKVDDNSAREGFFVEKVTRGFLLGWTSLKIEIQGIFIAISDETIKDDGNNA